MVEIKFRQRSGPEEAEENRKFIESLETLLNEKKTNETMTRIAQKFNLGGDGAESRGYGLYPMVLGAFVGIEGDGSAHNMVKGIMGIAHKAEELKNSNKSFAPLDQQDVDGVTSIAMNIHAALMFNPCPLATSILDNTKNLENRMRRG